MIISAQHRSISHCLTHDAPFVLKVVPSGGIDTSRPRQARQSRTTQDSSAAILAATSRRTGTARISSSSVIRGAGPDTEIASGNVDPETLTAMHRTPTSCSPSSRA